MASAAEASIEDVESLPSVSNVQAEDNKFQKAISAWRSEYRRIYALVVMLNSVDIDLTSLIPSLDNTASEIVQYQRDSTVQRKDLAQKTKDFRKLDDTGKLAEVKGLLKGRLCDPQFLEGQCSISFYSIPDIYRFTYQSLKVHKLRFPPGLLVPLRSPRSIPSTGGFCRFAASVRRYLAEGYSRERTPTKECQ
jgi:hypothetical protein